ncbi:hypothetical protein [Hymenobacter sp. HDW8]|uniref:hypothetical protein n=1 Tax=Hymenobacter sp. HDW8 TaxID=2714932 RepID=UPI00140A54BF|nr:hypothetical protein [Hymenobacter sp. HDW8]QIL78343.1 hypothetical protein G7064_21235 [Hymenobacter sp. HDW8]
MRKFLFFLALAIFLYSPYGPSWGQFVVNGIIVLSIFAFYSKGHPKRRYYDEEEQYH